MEVRPAALTIFFGDMSANKYFHTLDPPWSSTVQAADSDREPCPDSRQ